MARVGAWQNRMTPEEVRTKAEMEGRRIPVKMAGWRAEAQPEAGKSAAKREKEETEVELEG